jgi:transcriptional regulator with XRE-family HTH domain
MSDPEDPASAADLLRSARGRAALSQADLAARAGVPRTMVSAYERDLRQPSLLTLRRLVGAAGFDLRVHLAPRSGADEILHGLEQQFADPHQAARDHDEQRAAQARIRRAAAERERQNRRRQHGQD